MRYFVEVDGQQNAYGTWGIDGNSAQQLSGTPGPQQHTPQLITPNAGETSFDAMRRAIRILHGNSIDLVETKLSPGKYYPRIARPSDTFLTALSYPAVNQAKNEISTAEGQLDALTSQLRRICQTVHPIGINLDAFGHDIRNLLILACTEVEAQWRGVLQQNGAKPTGRDFGTVDYVKTCDAMQLSQYSVAFPHYPWLKPISPFGGWQATNPTTSIPWYNAYNCVKHDREKYFDYAKLSHAFQAVTACAIMIYAQFGNRDQLSSFFSIENAPAWSARDAYIYPYDGHAAGWLAEFYPF